MEHLQRLQSQWPDKLYIEPVFMPEEFAIHFYSGIDAFVMPSLEPGGIANQIANLCGTPVIAPLTGGIIDFFDRYHGSGFPFPKFDRNSREWGAINLHNAIKEAAYMCWDRPDELER